MIFDHVKEGLNEIFVRHSDDAVQILLEVGENNRARCFDRCTVRNRTDRRKRNNLAGLKGGRQAGCTLGLDADNLAVGAQKFDERGNAGCQSAAAHRNENVIDERKFLDDFHRDCALPGRDSGIIERRNIGVALFFGELVRVLARFIKNITVQNNLGPERFSAVYFDQRRGRRHDDDCLCLEAGRGVRDALRVVARRGGNQARFSLFFGKRADFIVGAAHFVGAGALHVFGLEIYLGTGLLTVGIRVDEVGGKCNFFYNFASPFKAFQSQFRHVVLLWMGIRGRAPCGARCFTSL